jgi:hypothetical protein
MSVEAAAHDRVKCLLTIKRNERSPSSEIAAHHQRNAQISTKNTAITGMVKSKSKAACCYSACNFDPLSGGIGVQN